MKTINSPVLAYCVNLAYTSIVVCLALVYQDALASLGEDCSEQVIIFTLALGTLILTVRSASIKCIFASLMGFENGILIPVLIIFWTSDYEIDWFNVWLVVIVTSTVVLIAALITLRRRRSKTRRIERKTHE
ncbi:MAG: hypothetical protein K9N55_05755 [Phycisphaerae bacterium]|nr:hypothetical protein [Phycisphaerae bacterium]